MERKLFENSVFKDSWNFDVRDRANARTPHVEEEEFLNKPAHAVPLANARQNPDNQKGKPGRPFLERALEGCTLEGRTHVHKPRPPIGSSRRALSRSNKGNPKKNVKVIFDLPAKAK